MTNHLLVLDFGRCASGSNLGSEKLPPFELMGGLKTTLADLKRSRGLRFIAVNPKRQKTEAHARFARYSQAKTYEEAVALGARDHDLSFDCKRGYVEPLPQQSAKTPALKPAVAPRALPLANAVSKRSVGIQAPSCFEIYRCLQDEGVVYRHGKPVADPDDSLAGQHDLQVDSDQEFADQPGVTKESPAHGKCEEVVTSAVAEKGHGSEADAVESAGMVQNGHCGDAGAAEKICSQDNAAEEMKGLAGTSSATEKLHAGIGDQGLEAGFQQRSAQQTHIADGFRSPTVFTSRYLPQSPLPWRPCRSKTGLR